MRSRQLEAVRVIVATALAAFTLGACAQDIGAHGPASLDLPRCGAARWSAAASTTP